MPGGSGYANYEDINNPKLKPPCDVPLYVAMETNTQEYGRVVRDFDQEEVWITTWPQLGWRPICEGTGNEGGIVSGDFNCKWQDDLAMASNEAVGGHYVTGRLPPGVSPDNRTHILTRESNYHPDGGQVFYPTHGNPFILALALPGDDIKPQDFVAFYFDGSCGFQIKANIWHQPLYSVEQEASYSGKQGKVHACIIMDSVNEFNQFMKIPLQPELAVNYHQ